MINKYYVYILCDPRKNDLPFYVGKGCDDRARTHLWEKEEKTDNIRKYRKIQKIRKAQLEPVIKYHSTNLTEDEAYTLEIELIKEYGRAKIDEGGILTNICIDNKPPDPTGRPVREETKQKIGDAQRGEFNHRFGTHWSEEEKQRRSEFAKANGIKPPVRSGPMSEEQKEAIGKGNIGKKRTAEQSAYLSSIRKGKKRGAYSEEHRKSISEALGGRIPTIGEQFGPWTVKSKGDDKRSPKNRGARAIFWLCECEHNSQYQASQYALLHDKFMKKCKCETKNANHEI